jgi:putative transposase
MPPDPATYRGYCFAAKIISHAVWLYHVFSLNLRDAELILAATGIAFTHESIGSRCRVFGSEFAAKRFCRELAALPRSRDRLRRGKTAGIGLDEAGSIL